jgi:phosphoribosylformylglycinamidine synthase I
VKKTHVAVLKSSGTNCDQETKIAFEDAGANASIILMEELYKNKGLLNRFHIVVFPGGFSYGDDIAAGKVWAIEINHFIMEEIKNFIENGKLVLGICNGFQVLVKLGLLPAIKKNSEQSVSLIFNDSARYEDRWVYLKKLSTKSVFVRNTKDLLYMPVAHAEGKFIVKNQKTIEHLFHNQQVIFQYVNKYGEKTGYPENPNGSVRNIAGICDATGRVLGLMPHPERAILKTQYPNWKGIKIKKKNMGITIIKNGVEYVEKNIL